MIPQDRMEYVKLLVKIDSKAVKVSNIQVQPKNGKYEISFNADT